MSAPPDGPRVAGSRLVIGIDLGTTNSLAAVRAGAGATPHVLRDHDGEPLIPSFVCFEPDGRTLVGRAAKALRLDHPERTVFSIKRLIGRSFADAAEDARSLPYPIVGGERGLPRVRIGERDYSPEEISAHVLREVRRTAELALGQPVREVVVTVPAWFDDAQRQATKDAAGLAGLECVRILNEPTAAALAYGIDGERDGTVLVYDLGGGTFDVSVLRIEEGVFRVLSTAGDTHLGGDDFDALLGERILAALPEGARTAAAADPYVRQAVRRAAEGLKIRLTEASSAELELDLGARGTLSVAVTRAQFEAAISPLVQRTLDCVKRAVADAGLALDEIDDIVLVGGSTRIPLVRARLERLCGKPPHTHIDPDQAVALGAAIQADVLAGNDKSLLLLDVIPLSLGIETLGGAVQKLILRNSTIPTSVTEEFSTGVDGQTSVDLRIFQGERELARDCRQLGDFQLRGVPPMPAGLPRIAVTFLVDADGVLRVTAREQRTGVQAGIQVVPSFGLTRDEVRRMMLDSLEHAQADFRAREAIEQRGKAEAMVRGTRRALELAELPPDQTYAVHKAVKALDRLLTDDADADALRAGCEELTKLTSTIADDVISSAVTKALRAEQEGRA
ncbi:MAG: Fe-S protein assembly chaperone HscA [Planctomycetes bacterium]|nr:Fe-S protein assembly chaperone HscA [Planctomycetota bacterium]